MSLTVGRLFAGVGGLDLGLERAGMQVRWQVEIDDFCRKVLAKHWPDVPKYGDIKELSGRELEPVDLICGGWPCQPHSVAGRRRGSDDEREMWPEFIRVIREVRPRWILGENSPGILSSESGRYFGAVLRDLAESGYDAEWQCIPAAAVGAPHIRDRLWLLAYSRCELGPEQDTGGRRRESVLPERGDRQTQERGEDRELVALVPGVHPGAPADWWLAQSRVDRSAHGVPDLLDRLRALGNAVVPQVAEWIGRRIVEFDRRRKGVTV